jgi:hypothetical protein
MAIAIDQTNEDALSSLKQINNDIRQALSEERTSARVQELLDRYRRTEAGLGFPDASPLIEAAARFREASATSIRRSADGATLTTWEASEMRHAARSLIYATNTLTLDSALEVLSDFEV